MSSAESSVAQAWRRIETWCEEHFPAFLGTLQPGATSEEIAAFEQEIGRELPAEVRESFTIHNGQERSRQQSSLFFNELLGLEEALAHWKTWAASEPCLDDLEHMTSAPADSIALAFANPGWIPLTSESSLEDHLGVDLAPGPAGQSGQIINFGQNEEDKYVLASSWGEFLNFVADLLEKYETVVDAPYWVALKEFPEMCFHDVLRELWNSGRWPPRS